MTFPKPPEIASRIGCLDDESFAPDSPGDAWTLRELVRNGNRYLAMESFVWRFLANAEVALGEGGGHASGIAWPFWHLATPVSLFPVPKKPGLTRLRSRFRVVITSGANMQAQIATVVRPFTNNPPSAEVLDMAGNGASKVYEKNDWRCRPEADELLGIYFRGLLDPDNDSPLSTGTYGGSASGTVGVVEWSNGRFSDYNGAIWNTSGSQVDKDGHYVIFRFPGDGSKAWGPAAIVGIFRDPAGNLAGNADGSMLYFWPTPPEGHSLPWHGLDYEIYKAPEYRINSMAVYSVDRQP